jgi:hypothetical protein
MAKTSPEKLAAALRANLARRKAGSGDAAAKSPKSGQTPAPDAAPKPPLKVSPRPKPA